MSFDVYLQVFRHGAVAGIPRQRVRQLFGAYSQEAQVNYWQLRYDELNYCDIDLSGDPETVEGLTVHRPCGDMRLWDSLASILALGHVVLYFPGCRAPMIARADVATHLPTDMIQMLGQPIVVASGADVLNEVRAV